MLNTHEFSQFLLLFVSSVKIPRSQVCGALSFQTVICYIFCFFVVSTINSYCLIMLYYSFSIAHRSAAVQLCCCCCCGGFCALTVQARIELSLLISPFLRFAHRATISWPKIVFLLLFPRFCPATFLLHFLIFTSFLSFSFARALVLSD